MNSGWQVVDCINLAGSIRYERGQLVIWKDDAEAGRIPLQRLAVLLVGVKASISGAVIAKLKEYDVALIVCDWKKTPIASLYPESEHTRVGARHRAQADLSLPRKKAAWAAIVRAKILGQSATLRALEIPGYKALSEMARSVKSGDPDNTEAQAARFYWARYPEDPDFRRVAGEHQVGELNSCLDYAYTILRGHTLRAIASAGLSGALGVFHHGRSNAFCLADDLMEPFRPAVDYYVRSSLESYNLQDSAVKQTLVAAVANAFDDSGRTIPTAVMDFAQAFGLYVEGDLAKLPVPVWAGATDA